MRLAGELMQKHLGQTFTVPLLPHVSYSICPGGVLIFNSYADATDIALFYKPEKKKTLTITHLSIFSHIFKKFSFQRGMYLGLNSTTLPFVSFGDE